MEMLYMDIILGAFLVGLFIGVALCDLYHTAHAEGVSSKGRVHANNKPKRKLARKSEPL